MIVDKMENGIWTRTDTDKNEVLCKIESLGNNVYKATNCFTKITAEIVPIDDYKTLIRCIENKQADKNGVYRKTKKLADHNASLLNYMCQEIGFARKAKPTT